jgi:DNA modification methylase
MILTVNISEIKTNPNNPRVIKDDKFKKLVKSIQDFPEMLNIRPIVVNSDMIVLGGNMRLKACREAGLKEIPIIYAENLTEEQQKEFIIKDNVGFGEWDWEDLGNNWDKEELEGWGLDLPEFEKEVLEATDDGYEIPEEIKTDIVLGDLFEIGEHRLLCGDSTSITDVEKLMNEKKADMVFTDPPYGIGYEYNSHKDTKGDDYLNFCTEWFHNLSLFSDLIIISTGWAYKKFWYNKNPNDEMVWFDKTKQSGGKSYFLRKTEPIFIFGKIREKYKWDIFENQSNRGDGIRDLHTCPKPIGLISDIINPQTEKNQIILDIFLGSGTTMVASHQLKRKCYGMELDPKYCQVIIDRMLKLDPSLKIKRNGQEYIKQSENSHANTT